MEGQTIDTGRGTGGDPYSPPPFVIPHGTAVGRNENQCVGVDRAEPSPLKVCGQGLSQDPWEAQGAPASGGLWGPGHRSATPTASLLLSHRQLPSKEVEAPDTQADRLTPAESEHGADPHDRGVVAEGVGEAGQVVSAWQAPIDGPHHEHQHGGAADPIPAEQSRPRTLNA
jgi:hypothetical protein